MLNKIVCLILLFLEFSHIDYLAHAYRRMDSLAGVVISDKEYPGRAAYALLDKALSEFSQANPAANKPVKFEPLKEYLVKYQDPSKTDQIMRVQQELDDTKVILHKTIESVLQRGEKLDSLVERSETLSGQSKMFYKTAKKNNSCCALM